MQKALTQMNVQLHQGVSDITGTTGMAIMRAIVAGERDPQVLAALRHHRSQRTAAEIAQALAGDYRSEQVFVLQQELQLVRCLSSPNCCLRPPNRAVFN